MGSSTTVSRVINAPPQAVYQAFLDQDALVAWLPPGSMTGVVHAFDACEGGAFTMSLVYPEDDTSARGKTSASTDTFEGRFVTLFPNREIAWAVEFESADASYAGEMMVRTTLAPVGSGTEVTIVCDKIPPGISPEDNAAGCRSSLQKLASYLAG
jgi:uncharacterized protein YndB with AHSA1/START domain